MTKGYFNTRAQIWDEAIAEKNQDKLKAIADWLEIKSGSTVLDVGTGTGAFIPFLLQKIGTNGRLICLDFAEEMLNKAKSKDFAGTIEFICADIEQSQLNSGICDAVVCYSSFPHFRDKQKALNEINRILKPGGKMFICHSSSRDNINHMHLQMPEVCNDLIPTDMDIQQLLTVAGFTGIDIANTYDRFLVIATKPG
jgi:ubiquinone/menaquinone biosynthesis C-methylase UbiE